MRFVNISRLAAWIVIWGAACFMLAPFAAVFLASISGASLIEVLPHHFSLQWYRKVFVDDPAWRRSGMVSLWACGGAAVLGLILSTTLVVAIESRRRIASVSYYLWFSLIAVPVPALALALYILFRALTDLPSWLALLLSYTVAAMPILLGGVRAGLDKADARLIEAAATLGAAPHQQLRLRFRLARPIIVAAFSLAVLFLLDDVMIAMFIADPGARPLSLLLWDGIRQSVSPAIAAASVILVLLAGVVGYVFVTPAFREEPK